MRRSNATKPPKFPRSVSVSTRIRSASVLAALQRPLRRRTSSRCAFSCPRPACTVRVLNLFASASFSPLARRRCRRRVHIINAAHQTRNREKPRKRACPQELSLLHGVPQHSPLSTRPPSRAKPPKPASKATRPLRFPCAASVHENRSARVLADSSSAKTASNSHRRLVASVPVSFSQAHPPSSPPAWTDHNAARTAAQGVRARSLPSLKDRPVIHRLREPFATGAPPAREAARRVHPPRYAATTSRWVASSAPVPLRTMRPRSMT